MAAALVVDQPTEPLPGIELCGDEAWYADDALRRALREAVAATHAEQKILVGPPAEEIRRICPGGGRVLGAGAVLRLGGSHHGGYGEADVNYAYRQLSRALHPDKNPGIPEAQDAFKRLTEASEELRKGLEEARVALRAFCQVSSCAPLPDALERPQGDLLAEASRVLTAVVALSGEGAIPEAAALRSPAAFAARAAFRGCHPMRLLTQWYDDSRLLDLLAAPSLRVAYDCARKRFRAQFLCALNRAAQAEAVRQDSCVRSTWQKVLAQFPETGLWRDLLSRLRTRVWAAERSTRRASKWDDSSGPATSAWATTWREIIREVLPRGADAAAPPADKEVRQLAAALWRDVVDWARGEGDASRHLELFTAEHGGQSAGAAEGQPESEEAQADAVPGWAFVPLADLLLIVGEGIVGATAEGFFAEGPASRERQPFEVAFARARDVENKSKKRKEPDGPSASSGAAKAEASAPSDSGAKQRKLSRSPTHVVLLTNLVGAGEMDVDFESEIAEEARKFGNLAKCVVREIPGAPDKEAVRVFLEYERVEDAAKAYASFNGRFFGGRAVRARFYDEQRFAKGDLEKNAPSKVVLLTNLVGPGQVDDDLQEETAEEAKKHGKLRKCVIRQIEGAPDEEAVRIFLKYANVEAAAKAFKDFNGRLFGGRKVRARYYDEKRFAADDLQS